MNRRVFEILGGIVVIACGAYGIGQLQQPADTSLSATHAAATATPVPAEGALATQPKTAAPRLDLEATVGFAGRDKDMWNKIQARFATGDFVTALKLADDALADNSLSAEFHRWTLAQLPVLLTSAGWSKLKIGECDAAIVFLKRSETIRRTLETAKGLAVCYYKNKDLVTAREQFAFYLEQTPGDAEMSLLYADVLESDERFDDAIKVLEQLETSLVGGTESTNAAVKAVLAQRLSTMRARAKQSPNQRVETSRNFRLLYRTEDHEDLVSYVLTTLEEALDEYIESYGFQAPVAPIEVVLYAADDFQAVTGGPAWAEGLFDGRLRVPIRAKMLSTHNYSVLHIVLRHELVHALFAGMSDSRNIPPWFDEGMAQRLSCGNSGCGAFNFPPTPGNFLPATTFAASYTTLSSSQAGSAYLQSLYLIYILEQCQGDDTLRQLVRHIGKATDISADGLLSPIAMSFNSLRDKAERHWKRRTHLGAPGEMCERS